MRDGQRVAAAANAALACRPVPLSPLTEWHIMAAWLSLLRAGLLLPEARDDTAQARVAGMRQRLADWLRICTRNNPAFRTELDTESDVGPVSPCRADALCRHFERR